MPKAHRCTRDCMDDWEPDDAIKRIASLSRPEDFPVDIPYQINISGSADSLEAIYTAYTLQVYPHSLMFEAKAVKDKYGTFALEHSAAHRRTVTDSGTDDLFRGEDWIALVSYWRKSKTATIYVAGSTELKASEIYAQIREGIEFEEKSDDPRIVEVNYWRKTSHGYARRERNIDVLTWEDIGGNYPQVKNKGLEKLINLTPGEIRGRLILLYGPPGTGKTTFLRAISTEWRDWCSFECVMDPDLMFSDSGYLQEVLFGDYGGDNDKWHLVILEDTGEMISSDAKSATGQALSRLLNMTDGILGQGAKVLVAITANERLGDMHKAVTRPGRCLAQVEIGKLSFPQAREWMAREMEDPVPLKSREYTLADLIALRNGEDIPEEDEYRIGQYA
jgi:hypothetical protein